MPHLHSVVQDIDVEVVCFDAAGGERRDDPDGLMSDRVLRQLSDDDQGVTDIFLLSHGWMGDIDSAVTQYRNWVTCMIGCQRDVDQATMARPNFKPAFIGLHWPSKPWGDESFSQMASFAANSDAGSLDESVQSLVDEYANGIADTPAARDALQRIILSTLEDVEPDTLSEETRDAFRDLNREVDLGIGGAGAGPGGDRSSFDPEGIYQALREDSPSFGILSGSGLFGGGGVLGVLRTLSFWKMKERAKQFGERAGSNFLARMMQAGPRNLRFHLMGHSFGCIVMSATLAGPKGRGNLARPVESLALIQGALSIWSFCNDIPATPGQAGYFNKVVSDRRVRGATITTQSVFDTATGKWYPLGAGVAGQVAFAVGPDLPKFGAVGTHGAHGPGVDNIDRSLGGSDLEYKFEPGRWYNLESSEIIRNGEGSSGAHSDIYHPQVAHAKWQAALSTK